MPTMEEVRKLRDVFDAGYRARHEWKPRGRDHAKREKPINPHSLETKEGKTWEGGFNAAEKEIAK